MQMIIGSLKPGKPSGKELKRRPARKSEYGPMGQLKVGPQMCRLVTF